MRGDKLMRQIYKIFFLTFLLCVTACQERFEELDFAQGNEKFELYASPTSGYVVKSGESQVFGENTLFHIYGTKPALPDVAEDWSDNLMKAEGSSAAPEVLRGIAGNQDGRIRKIEALDGDNAISPVFRNNSLNLYGVTAVCISNDAHPETPEEIQMHNEQLEEFLENDEPENNVPQYKVAYSENVRSLPDVMWSTLKDLSPRNNAGKITMPFKHTLTKLNFIAVQGDELDETIKRMYIKSVVVKDYNYGILDMADGLYSRPETESREWVNSPAIEFENTKEIEVVKNQENAFGSFHIFPTTGAVYDPLYDENGEAIMPEVDDGDAVMVRLKVNVVRVREGSTVEETEELTFDNVKLTHYEKNAPFHPNCEYYVTFTLTTNSTIVTLRPQYYEYIGEPADSLKNSVGEPTDFGGVMWAAANLGATSANPTVSAEEWERARGFYYQYGRNIPYYVRGSVLDPYPDIAVYTGATRPANIDKNTWEWDYNLSQYLYDDNRAGNISTPFGHNIWNGGYSGTNGQDTHGARPFPYIPALWEKEIEEAGSIDAGYRNFLRKTRIYTVNGNDVIGNGQTAPTANYSDVYEALAEIAKPAASRKLNGFAFSTYVKNGGRYWNQKDFATSPNSVTKNWAKDGNNESSPCPKGWRVPSYNEFMSIFPISERTGDIAFNRHSSNTVNTPHNADIKAGATTWRESATGDYDGGQAIYVGIYNDGRGYSDIGLVTGISDHQGWGSIFGIKRLYTDDAYALRWEIETVDYVDGKREANVNSVQKRINEPRIGRGVLVISKYDLESKYSKNQVSLTTEKLPSGSAAEYKCIGFLDNNPKNGRFDEGDETAFDIDWDHPSGKLYLPIPGYVLTIGSGLALIYPGTEALYWSSDYVVDGTTQHGKSVRIKHAGDVGTRFVFTYGEEMAANGAHVRCVRDVTAVN